MRCSKCGDEAIVSQRYSGLHLCRGHFIDDVERKAENTILKEKMVADGDRIAVALSGGKDSTALLYILDRLLRERKGVEIFAVTVDEGIKGYREETIKSASRITRELGVEHITVSFKDEFGLDLDEMVAASTSSGRREAPCTYCGVFRKTALNRTARNLRATKVATGHDLDDEAQTVAMNYLKGDIERLARFAPRRVQRDLVPRIKPLKAIPEKEVALYAMVNGFYSELPECPYAYLSLRSDVKEMLNRFEMKFPGTKHSIVRGFESISGPLAKKYNQVDLASCRLCGEPCVDELCKACQLLERMMKKGVRGKE